MTTRPPASASAVPAVRRCAVVRALLTAAPLALAAAVHAAEPPRPAQAVDVDLLEFLGSGDDGDLELQSFLLERTEAVNASAPVNTKPATGTTVPSTGSTSR